jgi:hypothetical protein
MRVKVDLSHLIDQIFEVLNSSRSQKAKELNFGISIGIEMFLKYLEIIGNRAIEINDAIIQECLLDLCVLRCTPEEEKTIREKAKDMMKSE